MTFIYYGPPVYYPLIGTEGGPERLQVGYYRFLHQRWSGVYVAVRIRGRHRRFAWLRPSCRG